MEHLDLIQDLAKIEARFREILKAPKLIIDLNKSWGAEHPTHRLDIRQGILMKFPQADSQQLLNLQNPPSRPLGTSDSPSFSVSHTIGLGGYAASAHGSVGFDIELVNRVTAKIAARVSIGEELALAPNPSVLWVAKEATFKSLLPLRQPSTLSQFETFRWKKIDSLFETFLLKQPEQFGATGGSGSVYCNGQYVVGVFVVDSKA